MPFLNKMGGGSSRRFGFSKISFLAAFFDLFDRANSASAIGGTSAAWTATSGTWGVLSNKAYAITAASSYPVATFDALSQKATVKATLDTTGGAGSGVAFWVTDASNWWGVIAEKTAYTAAPYNCPTNGTNTAVVSGSNCTYNYATNTVGGGPYPATGGGPYGACGCYGYTLFGCGCFYYSPTNYWTFATGAYGYTQPAPYNYFVQPAPYNYTTNYTGVNYAATPTNWQKHELKVIKKTAGTVSTVQSTTVSDSTTSQNMVYVQAAANSTNVIVSGAVSSTPNTIVSGASIAAGTPVPATKHGILFAPATASGVSSIDRFDYNAV